MLKKDKKLVEKIMPWLEYPCIAQVEGVIAGFLRIRRGCSFIGEEIIIGEYDEDFAWITRKANEIVFRVENKKAWDKTIVNRMNAILSIVDAEIQSNSLHIQDKTVPLPYEFRIVVITDLKRAPKKVIINDYRAGRIYSTKVINLRRQYDHLQ